jgi:ABC-type multidrug transport system ATPase subunit
MPVAIEADGLVKHYGKGVRALDGLTFEVAAGTVFRTAPASRRRSRS